MLDDNDTQNDIENHNKNTDNDHKNASRRKRRKRQKGFIVPLETKVMCQQMKDLNHSMQYETVIGKYWPTDSDHNTELDDQYAPITGNIVQMKDVFYPETRHS